jgi:hypothetical protein
MSESDEAASPNQTRGRPFAPGNPGRPLGAKNKSNQLAAGLLAEAAPEIVRVVVEGAKAGDKALCKMALPYVLPKQRAVELELPPLNGTGDTSALIAAIIKAVADGQITPSDGGSLIGAVEAYVRVKNVDDLVSRVEALEKNLSAT